jgi:glycosyltransferase involved in cell wall biosynthesis
MAKIAIVDLLFTWPPDGGARTDVKEIATRLAKEHQVCLFVPDYQHGFKRGLITGNLPFEIRKIPFPTIRSFTRKSICRKIKQAVDEFIPDKVWITDAWYMKPHLVLALRKYRPILRFYAYESLCLKQHGILFRQGNFCPINFLTANLAERLTCFVCTLHHLNKTRDKTFIQEYFISGAYSPRYRKKVIKAIQTASQIIVYNNIIKDRISHLNDKVQITPSGVDLERFPIRSNLSHSTLGPVKIFMAGRTDDFYKGFSILRNACQQLWKKRQDFQLIATSTEKFEDKFIISTGWLNQEELPQLYLEADICVVPSVWPEPFGIVALEAMAAGKPVIASNVGGLKTIVRDNETGFLVPPLDSDALLQKLEILLDDPHRRSEMGKRARQLVAEQYTWEYIYHQYYRHLFTKN